VSYGADIGAGADSGAESYTAARLEVDFQLVDRDRYRSKLNFLLARASL